MIDLMTLCAFNAAYAMTIDSDALEEWPEYFSEDTHYRITHIENENENLPAGIVYADSRNMLIDRIAALRLANSAFLAASICARVGLGVAAIAGVIGSARPKTTANANAFLR